MIEPCHTLIGTELKSTDLFYFFPGYTYDSHVKRLNNDQSILGNVYLNAAYIAKSLHVLSFRLYIYIYICCFMVCLRTQINFSLREHKHNCACWLDDERHMMTLKLDMNTQRPNINYRILWFRRFLCVFFLNQFVIVCV